MLRSLTALAGAAALAAACTPGRDDAGGETPASASPTAAEVTPAYVRGRIETVGAQATVEALSTDYGGAGWTVISDGVADGEAAWLALAPMIKPGTADATAYDLASGLSRALLVNPQGVLAGAGGGPDHCVNVAVTYADDQGRIARSNDAYYPAAIAAVEGVTEPALTEVRAACLRSLRAGQAQGATAPPDASTAR